ncbi:hypothetical protein QIA37_00520 (plasmid) [Borrelia sp. CA_690]|uniref:Surface lipoprotein P27 n=1 Tax=Borrelia maritima TaxID=2761123 RepID=A0A5J6WDU0_9SPIR|nr:MULTISPECIES: hypothetical protein [Borrelia]QFI14995.1 hypothetical protein DB723_04515 [Borrelia maritima]WKC84002.1 hypothetical protein QIA37_00520 [Borrelia sp. CA_690]
MGKKAILTLLGILILSCDLFPNREQTAKESKPPAQKIKEPENPEQTIKDPKKNKKQKPAAKIGPVVSIQKVEIRQSNQVPTTTHYYYKQAYPIQTFSLDFSIKRENEFQKAKDKILPAQGKVESLSILINKKLLDFKTSKKLNFKNLQEIENIENFFQNQDLLFVLNLKTQNNKNIINLMLNPPNDTNKPKDYALLDLKKIIKNGVREQYLNPIYRFQIKNNKDYHSIDYNKVSVGQETIELDLLPHNQVFRLNKNFALILEMLTNLNYLKSVIKNGYI